MRGSARECGTNVVLFFPAEGFDEVVDVGLHVVEHGCQGVVVGGLVDDDLAVEEVGAAVGDDELAGGGHVAALDMPDGGIDMALRDLYAFLLDARGHTVVVFEHAHGGVGLCLQVVAAGEGLVHQLYIAAPLGVAELEGGAATAAPGLGDEGVTVHLEVEGRGEGDGAEAVGSAHGVHRHILLRRQVDAEIGLGLGLRHITAATGGQQENEK